MSLDADAFHVGTALQQQELGGWRALSFSSAKLSASQQHYPAFDRELLGVFLSPRHFHFKLEVLPYNGSSASSLSSHSCFSALVHLYCQLAYTSKFTSDICHTHGAANVVGDTLSRPSPPIPYPTPFPLPPDVQHSELSDCPVPSPFPISAIGIDFAELAAEQLSCPDLLCLQKSPTLFFVTVSVVGSSLLCDSKTKVLRLLVPFSKI